MKLNRLGAAALFAAGALAHAQGTQPADHAAHHASVASPAAGLLSEGEVRKVDLSQGKITLRHGPLPNLDMPGMTMVFTVADKKLLDGLKVGDKVRFTADKRDGTYVVVAIEPAG
jgi:Cu/Ag efflux protein CusF